MKKAIGIVLGSMFVFSFGALYAQECDPWSKDLEVYHCKKGKKEVTKGNNKREYLMCIEYKKITPTKGCIFEKPFSTKDDLGFLFIIGKKGINWTGHMGFKCDNYGGYSSGGFERQSIGSQIVHLPEEYYDGEMSLDERTSKFKKDLEKKGKELYDLIEIAEPPTEHIKDEQQTCYYEHMERKTIGAKFSVKRFPPSNR